MARGQELRGENEDGFWTRAARAGRARGRHPPMQLTRRTAWTFRQFFFGATKWIFKRSLKPKARRLRSAKSSSIRARRSTPVVIFRFLSSGKISAPTLLSFRQTEK